MINILYFARVREGLGLDSEQIDLGHDVRSVADLIDRLCHDRGERWHDVLGQDNLLVAVNQTMVKPDHAIADGDEVAFFPPVSGG